MTADPWYTRAACQLHDAALFDLPEGNERRSYRSVAARLTKARQVCRRCPVIARCRAEAFLDGGNGIRGGDLFENGEPIDLEAALQAQDAARRETRHVYGVPTRERVSA